MAALTHASSSFLSIGIESLRPSEHTTKRFALKSVTSITASCRPTWQRPSSSQKFQRARQAAAMAATWQAMGCQPGMSSRTDPGSWWTESVPRGRGGNPLEEMLSQLVGEKGYQVEQRENGWILRFEFPGLSSKDVKVQVENERVLLIGSPDRTTRVALPDRCHVAGLQARMRFGLLTVTLPRTAPSRNLRDVTLSEGEDVDVAAGSDDVSAGSADVAVGSADVGDKDVLAREKGELGGKKEGEKREGGEEERDWWKDGTTA